MTHAWDNVGNLLSRVDSLNGIAEGFCYDALNRLRNYSVSNNGGTNCNSGNLLTKSMAYDAGGDGDIETKSDVGTYNYAGQGPHAVSSITTGNTQLDGVANPGFFYDRDGNMMCVTTHTVCGGNAARLYSWTTFDMLEVVQQGANSVAFSYTPEHERFTQTTASATLMYANDPVGGIMSERLAGSTITWRTYLMAYGRIVAERFTQGASATMDYVAGDHLMSTAALTNTGSQNTPYAIPEKDSWDAWGKRRNINGSDNANCSITSGTLRGFTGQEMMDSFCLVNLNGRVYDPTIGRFLSADPTVPDPLNGQSLNRYSYVLNNPLALVDPSGFTDTCNDSDKCQIYSEGSSPCWGCSGAGVWGVSMDGTVISAAAASLAFAAGVPSAVLSEYGLYGNFGLYSLPGGASQASSSGISAGSLLQGYVAAAPPAVLPSPASAPSADPGCGGGGVECVTVTGCFTCVSSQYQNASFIQNSPTFGWNPQYGVAIGRGRILKDAPLNEKYIFSYALQAGDKLTIIATSVTLFGARGGVVVPNSADFTMSFDGNVVDSQSFMPGYTGSPNATNVPYSPGNEIYQFSFYANPATIDDIDFILFARPST